ncbi:MAG TPA: riboflavin synthase [Actinomycetota bacterium]|nr:riboflavin synthase [Actinomycetota bacterium]
MFTGIVETVGTAAEVSGSRIRLESDLVDLVVGESIAVNGVCLTVTAPGSGSFSADISEETARRTSLGSLRVGSPVNLERAMPAGGRFGGHIVQGHVDGVGSVADVRELPGSVEMSFSLPPELERYLVHKGSVTLEGVSLTVAALEPGGFAVALIPHTLQSTTFGTKLPGDAVNIEVDVLAKYVERLLGYTPEQEPRR